MIFKPCERLKETPRVVARFVKFRTQLTRALFGARGDRVRKACKRCAQFRIVKVFKPRAQSRRGRNRMLARRSGRNRLGFGLGGRGDANVDVGDGQALDGERREHARNKLSQAVQLCRVLCKQHERVIFVARVPLGEVENEPEGLHDGLNHFARAARDLKVRHEACRTVLFREEPIHGPEAFAAGEILQIPAHDLSSNCAQALRTAPTDYAIIDKLPSAPAGAGTRAYRAAGALPGCASVPEGRRPTHLKQCADRVRPARRTSPRLELDGTRGRSEP